MNNPNIKTAVTALAKVCFWFLRQIDFQTLNIYSFRLLANVKEQYCLVNHRLCWQKKNKHIILSENSHFRWNFKSGSLNLLEPSGPVKACNGIALPFTFVTNFPHLTYRPKDQNHKRKTPPATHISLPQPQISTPVSNVRPRTWGKTRRRFPLTMFSLHLTYNVRYKEKKSDTRHGRQEVAMS
jgi:hypothetical protein